MRHLLAVRIARAASERRPMIVVAHQARRLLRDEAFGDFAWVWPDADRVSEVDQTVETSLAEHAERRIERGQVGMGIGENREAHGQIMTSPDRLTVAKREIRPRPSRTGDDLEDVTTSAASSDARDIDGADGQHLNRLLPAHVGLEETMDPVQNQPALAPANDVKRIGQVRACNAKGVLGIGDWVSSKLGWGDLKPEAVVAPPRELQMPAELVQRDPRVWESSCQSRSRSQSIGNNQGSSSTGIATSR
jgi:hypothetical protein